MGRVGTVTGRRRLAHGLSMEVIKYDVISHGTKYTSVDGITYERTYHKNTYRLSGYPKTVLSEDQLDELWRSIFSILYPLETIPASHYKDKRKKRKLT